MKVPQVQKRHGGTRVAEEGSLALEMTGFGPGLRLRLCRALA